MSDIQKLLSKLMHYNDELTNDDRCDLSEYIKKLQAENVELEKQSNKQVRKVLCEIGTELEDDDRIDKKSMPFVRDVVINKIYDYPTPPEGE